MTLDDQPVDNFALPVSGVKYDLTFEERLAAVHSLIPWADYLQMTAQERAGVIAFYRVKVRLDAIIDQRQAKDLKRSRR